jgi:hypothetical protein
VLPRVRFFHALTLTISREHSMKTATFDPRGGAIEVAIEAVPRRDGSYDLILWKADENKVVKEWSGNFINTDDDEYSLPRPNAKHDGRLLEAMIVVAVPQGAGPCTVSMTVTQDGNQLARDQGTAAPGAGGVLNDLFIKLESA